MRNKVIYNGVTYPDVKLSSGTITQETSLQVSQLTIDTFEVEVKSKDPTIVNFTQNAPLEYYRGDVLRDVYYVQYITRVSPDHYLIGCISALGRLAQRDHLGGIYNGQLVEDVVAEMCGDLPFYIKSNLMGTKIYGWLPIANSRDNMRRLLFALGANLWQDHDGVLRISALWDGLASVLDADRIYIDGASVKTDKPVTSVTVLEHQYTTGTERRELFTGVTTQGQRIPFDGPMSDLEATGFTILSSGANYAVVSAGTGSLTGSPYIHTTLEITRKVSEAPVANDVRIEDATLVSLVNSTAVAGRLASYYACRTTIQVDATIRHEHPGEVVQIIHPYDRTMVYACISAADVSLSATLKGSLTALVDFKPQQDGGGEFLDERVILTGEGDWIPPEGTVEVTGVAISGATGGASGLMGKVSPEGQQVSGSDSRWNTRYQRRYTGPGGEGGDPGEGGEGGRILRFSMTVQPGVPVHYKCGQGGAPGQSNKDLTLAADDDASAPGQAGEDTVFGEYTTADGAVSPTGYIDPITGDVYALPGLRGVAGGHGGGLDPDGEWNSQAVGPDVVYNGVTYKGGATNSGTNSAQRTIAAENVQITAGGYAGTGGGAAAGADGEQSTAAVPTPYISRSATVAATTASAWGAPGGKGGDAVAPEQPESIGQGGTGGNGGGGVGGGGASLIETFYGGTTGTIPPMIGYPYTLQQSSPLSARGLGSDGAPGGQGGIILYYKRLKTTTSGALVTSKKNFFVDAAGRLFIV